MINGRHALVLVAGLLSVAPRPGLGQSRPAAPAGRLEQVRTCAAVVATFPPSTSQPGRICSTMAGVNGFSIDFGSLIQGPGSYQFEIDVDGQRFSCTEQLPWASCQVPFTCQWSLAGTARLIQVERSGCALPPAQQSLSRLVFEGVCPGRVDVRVRAGGRELAHWAGAVQYRRVVPNGEGCRPVNAQGTPPPRVQP